MKTNIMFLPLIAVLVISPGFSMAETEDFNSVTAGTVIAGEMPDGGIAPGTSFSGFTLSVTNNGGGPSSLIIFDSDNPTGGDEDLGTPNAAFGGPGEGSGGASGPGSNNVALHNLLICAENIHDWNNDDLVDDPDDEAGGCTIVFDFDEVVDLESITFVDIDDETVDFEATDEGALVGNGDGGDLGPNSVQTIDLSDLPNVSRLIVEFSSSGAIGELKFSASTVATEKLNLGAVKALYR